MFDASAKVGKNPSLNECLYSGPCLLTLLFTILLRFRLQKIGLISDIKQAFLNVSVGDQNRDYMRFLWFNNPLSSNPKIIVMRFLRVMFGIISSPFLLNGTIRYHLQKYRERWEQFVVKFLRDLYVDDSTSVFNTVQEGYEFYEKAKTIMNDAGFELRKWASNSPELMNLINNKEKSGNEVNEIVGGE